MQQFCTNRASHGGVHGAGSRSNFCECLKFHLLISIWLFNLWLQSRRSSVFVRISINTPWWAKLHVKDHHRWWELCLQQICPKSSLGAKHGMRSDFRQLAASVLKCIIYGPLALLNRIINHAGLNCNFSFYIMVAAPHCNFAWPCDSCRDPYQLISAMVTVDKKRKVGDRFQERGRLQYFFTEYLHYFVHLISSYMLPCMRNSMWRHQTKDAKAYDKLSGSVCTDKVKQLEAVLASQQWFANSETWQTFYGGWVYQRLC